MFLQFSGLGSCKERRSAIETRVCFMSAKNVRTFVIHCRNQILSSFGLDKLCPIFFGSMERPFQFIRQTQPFFECFRKGTIFECLQESRREEVTRTKPKADVRKAGSANNDADETSRPPILAGRAS